MRVSTQNSQRIPRPSGRAVRLGRVNLHTPEGHGIILPGQRLNSDCRRGTDRRRMSRAPQSGAVLDIRV